MNAHTLRTTLVWERSIKNNGNTPLFQKSKSEYSMLLCFRILILLGQTWFRACLPSLYGNNRITWSEQASPTQTTHYTYRQDSTLVCMYMCQTRPCWPLLTSQEGLTVRRFFTFPSPINSAESRLHACLCTLLVAAALALSWFTGSHWLWVYVAYGYMARALCGPRVDPQVRACAFGHLCRVGRCFSLGYQEETDV